VAISLGPVYNSTAIISAAHHPEIRLFVVDKAGSTKPLDHLINASVGKLGTYWTRTTPDAVESFSAICYLTALELQKIQHGGSSKAVYGLIDDAIGSTDVQSWMSAEMRSDALHECWIPRGAAALPPSASHAPGNQTRASELWNAMVNPISKSSFSAVLWDQGENNAHYCSTSQYNCLFGTMINGWRKAMNDETLPVAFVQLGGYSGQEQVSTIRFAQSDTLSAGTDQIFSNRTANDPTRVAVPMTAMAPTYDLGSPEPGHPNGTWWIHCRNKTEVARRLALQLDHIWKGGKLTALERGDVSEDGNQQTVLAQERAQESQEWSGPTVSQTLFHTNEHGHPFVEITMTHADGIALMPAQGCVSCCNQTAAGSTNTTDKCMQELDILAGQNATCSKAAPASHNWTCFDCVKDHASTVGGGVDQVCFAARIAQHWCGFPNTAAPTPAPPDGSQTYLFEVSNKHGVWLPATGSVAKNGSVMVVPKSNVTAQGGHWLSGVRFGVMDIPQCVLYNNGQFPAVPFEFPVPYTPKN
jgi:hypothetical protein